MGRAYEIDTHKAAEAKTEVPATPSSTLPSDLDPDPDFTGTNSTHADNRPYGLEYEQEEHGTRRFSSNFATLRRPSDGLAHYESSFRYAGHPSGNEGSQNALRWERRASASVTHWYEEDDTSGQSGIPYPLVEASTGLWKGSNEDEVELVDPTSTTMSEAVYLGATCTPASDTVSVAVYPRGLPVCHLHCNNM
ncbi:hypothetical protein I316_05640 [Kwoniella heveanensis BCC8398]|uniref:Uncharacterized protein n=1 Tax=Kwoniella heveanensis BCC8398 TaxID=1296120 RepID=A0A1B9GNP3_9TREE|nr:hypothetical protein I316_05640 [Kwoniella heveanensis BCC8398]